MPETIIRDLINAEAAIKGKLKDKDRENEDINQYRHIDNIGSYNKYGLFTVISVLMVTVTLFLAIFESLFYLFLLPVIYGIDIGIIVA